MSASTAGLKASDPGVWLQAQGAFAADLAAFQSSMPSAPSDAIEHLLPALEPIHHHGFCWSIAVDTSGAIVSLLHRSGWDASAQVADAADAYGALASLAGIVIGDFGSPVSAVTAQPQQPVLSVVAASQPSATAEPDEFGDDLIGPGKQDHPILHEDQQPLSAADRETCLGLIRAMAPDVRKSFTVAFRSHFNIGRESQKIAPHIVQQVHMKFIQSYLDEIELNGEAA